MTGLPGDALMVVVATKHHPLVFIMGRTYIGETYA